MNIIAVDDETSALRLLKRAIEDVIVNTDAVCFEFADEAMEYARQNKVDIAFLDIEMSEMSGLDLAKELTEINEKTNVIFVSGYSDYMSEAFDLYASGYVLKPVTPERIRNEISHLRYMITPSDKKIRIQCFGNFEIFVEGKPIAFGRQKAKEALAYIVDRKGAGVSKKELAAILWEDKEYNHSVQSHVYTLIKELTRTLIDAGVENVFIMERGFYYIDTDRVDCDYYNYEKGEESAMNSFHGEYMNNYSWAEEKAGFLEKTK